MPGAVVSTLKLRVAEVAWLPAASVARTSNECGPAPSAEVVCGELQPEKPPPSTEHWNVAPASFEEKPKVGVGSFVGPFGPESIEMLGAVVSTLTLRVAAALSFPAASIARTANECEPSLSAAVVWGELQAA